MSMTPYTTARVVRFRYIATTALRLVGLVLVLLAAGKTLDDFLANLGAGAFRIDAATIPITLTIALTGQFQDLIPGLAALAFAQRIAAFLIPLPDVPRCPRCGYTIKGIHDRPCPECGLLLGELASANPDTTTPKPQPPPNQQPRP